MVPLRYTEGGVLARRGHTEAATGKPRIEIRPLSIYRFGTTLLDLILTTCFSSRRSLQIDQPSRRRSLMRDRQARRPIRIHGEAGRLQGVCSTVGVQDDQYRSVAGLYGEAEEGGAGMIRDMT
jgi:hypothetical protein